MLQKYVKNPRILAVLFLGFSSGMPLALTGATLQAWFTDAGVGLVTIGALSLVGMPYTWKFLWAPLLDRFAPLQLGRRRGWILLSQLALVVTIILLGLTKPAAAPGWVAALALLVAFLSASQDIAVDAYRTDVLAPTERGLGAAAYTFAYRIAMLVSGGLALVLAQWLGWKITYQLMAGLIGLTMLATLWAPNEPPIRTTPATLKAAWWDALKDLWQRPQIVWLLLFIVLYKLGDALALSLMSNFLLRGLQFSLTEVGLTYKTVGLAATIIGAFVGGACLTRMRLYSALLYFGLLQACSNLSFVLLALTGKSSVLMVGSIALEAFCSGMSTAAFVAFLMMLCNHRYSAMQFACLSALAAIGRVFMGPIAGLIVLNFGWVNFYLWAFVLSFPGILLLTSLRNTVDAHAAIPA